MTTEFIANDGEVVETAPSLEVLSGGLVADLSKAEIAQQVATARQYPRSVKRASTNINSLVTLDEEAAQDCIYALPRGGKPIRGPSIRLAEVVAQSWGNNRVAARVVEIDRVEKVVVAEAVFHDLETNAAVKTSVRRSIADRSGRVFKDDMIVVTGNAACSIAKRNAILSGVPKAVWNRAYNAAEGVIRGDVRTLAERRSKAISAFGTWGVKPEQLYAALGVAGEEEVTLDHLPTLIGMFNAIKNGEETVESLFSNRATAAGKQFEKVANPLKDDETPAGGNGPAGGVQGEAAAGATGGAPAAGKAGAKAEGSGQGSATQTPERQSQDTNGREQVAADEAEPKQKAFSHGSEVARSGGARRAPRALGEDGREDERAAWFEGYDQARGKADEAQPEA